MSTFIYKGSSELFNFMFDDFYFLPDHYYYIALAKLQTARFASAAFQICQTYDVYMNIINIYLLYIFLYHICTIYVDIFMWPARASFYMDFT